MNASLRLQTRIVVLCALALGVTNCRKKMVESSVSSADGTSSESCDLNAMENAIETQGLIQALQSGSTDCLDGTNQEAATEPSTDTQQVPATASPSDTTITGESSLDASGLALVGLPKKADVVVVVGWEVMNDLLSAVSEKSLNGAATTQVDAKALRSQINQVVGMLGNSIRPYGGNVGLTLYYSYNDLYSIIKTKFVDPAIFGYSGIGHRIVQRRYANGGGLVYRIVTRILGEELAKYDALVRSEVAKTSTDTVRLSFLRADRNLNTSQESFLTLWLDNAVAGRTVGYREIKSLVQRLVATFQQIK